MRYAGLLVLSWWVVISRWQNSPDGTRFIRTENLKLFIIFSLYDFKMTQKPFVTRKTAVIKYTNRIQYNLDGSNIDGSFTFCTMANSNSFLSPYEILPIAQENKHLRKFSYFIVKLYVVCTHYNRLIGASLMSTLNIQSLYRKSKRFP